MSAALADPRLSVGLRVPLGAPLPVLADVAAEAEQAGLDGIGVPDHHHTGRDAFMALAAMAGRTERVRLFPATSNVVTRHPLVLAALTASVDELAPGRSELTVAPGFLSVEKAGEPQARRERLRQVVLALRGLLSEGRAELDGHPLELFHRPPDGGRVTVLASGPRLLELAGEVADGVLMLVGLDPASVAAAREHVAAGARRAGRDPAEVEETLIVPIGLGTPADARAWVQGWFRPGQPWLRYPSASNLRWLGHAGIELAPDYRPEDVDDALADRVADAFGLFGPAGACAERLLRAREETGLSRVFLFPAHSWDTTYALPRDEITAFGETIGPALRSAGC